MKMECTSHAQLYGLQELQLNVIWVADGKYLSMRITYLLVIL